MTATMAKAISIRQIFRLYAEMNGGIVATRDLLAFHLREGHIRARIGHEMESTAPSYARAWRESGEAYRAHKAASGIKLKTVRVGRWWRSMDWLTDREAWKIGNSSLCVTIQADPPKRIMMRHVRFNSVDVKRYFDPASRIKNFKHVGRSSDRVQWRYFWHEVVRLIKNDLKHEYGMLEDSHYKSNDKLSEEIFDKLMGQGKYFSQSDSFADTVESRIPFKLSLDSIKEEVEILRKALRLSRDYRKR